VYRARLHHPATEKTVNFNKVILGGHLTRDPELKHTQSNTSVVNFGLAVNEKWTDAGGNKQEKVIFIDCTAWAAIGETINAHMGKGSPILVEGRLNYETWADRDTGEERRKISVTVEGFQFVGGKKDEGQGEKSKGGRR
jgi:single-strand DNA-binding protein